MPLSNPPLVYIWTVKTASTSRDVFFQQFVMRDTGAVRLFEAARGRHWLPNHGIVAARAPQADLSTPWLSHMSISAVKEFLSSLERDLSSFSELPFLWVTSIRNPIYKLFSTFPTKPGFRMSRSLHRCAHVGVC